MSMDDEARARDERARCAVQRADDAIAAMAVDTWRSALLTAKVTVDSLVVMLRAELAGDVDHGLRMLNCAALVEAAKCIDEAVAVPTQAVMEALTERDAAREEMAEWIRGARAAATMGSPINTNGHTFETYCALKQEYESRMRVPNDPFCEGFDVVSVPLNARRQERDDIASERDTLRQQLTHARDAAVRDTREAHAVATEG